MKFGKDNYLFIVTEHHIFQISLNVEYIDELILELKHILLEIRRFEKVKYYFIDEDKMR